MNKPTSEQFKDYVRIQKSGRTNMFDLTMVCALSRRLAATRHIVFNYAKIADYYAHAGEEMQNLMEKSALVLIDIDDAIANGYIQLSKDIDEIMRTSGEKTK